MSAYNTLPEMLLELPSNDPQHPSLCDRVDGAWQATHVDLLRERVGRLAIALNARGLEKGEPVGLLVRPSADWLIMDLAIQMAGGVSVPFFVDFSADHVAYKIRDAGIRSIFVMGQDLWSRFAPLAPLVKAVLTDQPLTDLSQYVSYTQLLQEGDKRFRKKRSLPKELCKKVQPDDVATILYTSGSTGDPKGVELTQRNFMSQLAGLTEWFRFEPGEDVALSCLPLAHAFERTVLYFYLSQRIDVYFADDVHRLPHLLKDVRPTMMTTVPRMLEKIYDKMWERAHMESGWRRSMAEWVLQSATHHDEADSGRLGRKVAEEIIGHRVKKALGGRLKVMVTGGAAMRPDLYDFYVRVGVPLLQGYGLTEASPIISTNAPHRQKIGTVGKPLPNVTVRIALDGEILAKGPNIMKGYHGKPEETARVVDAEGWLHTGDIGRLDPDGYLMIEARKKELFKTSTGEYVSPVSVEQALCRSPLIEMACVVAEGRKYASCLLFVNREGLMRMKQAAGASTQSLEDYMKCAEVQDAVAALIKQVNEPLDPWARIQHHLLILDSPTIENGGLTPTMKLCRHVIERKYQDELNTMYRDAQHAEDVS